MKKALYSLLVFLFCSSHLEAQDFSAGFMVGPVVSEIDGDGVGGLDKLGYSFGGFVNREIDKNITFQFEIRFTEKGSKKPADLKNDDPESWTIKLSYIDFPLLLQYTPDAPVVFEAGAGPAYLLGVKYRDESGTLPHDNSDEVYKRLEAFGCVGAHFIFNDHASVNARYNYSFLNISKAEAIPELWGFLNFADQSVFNKVISLSFYYTF